MEFFGKTVFSLYDDDYFVAPLRGRLYIVEGDASPGSIFHDYCKDMYGTYTDALRFEGVVDAPRAAFLEALDAVLGRGHKAAGTVTVAKTRSNNGDGPLRFTRWKAANWEIGGAGEFVHVEAPCGAERTVKIEDARKLRAAIKRGLV